MWSDWGEQMYGLSGFSVVDASEALGADEDTLLEEVDELVSNWQDVLANEDTTGAPPDAAQQEAMMASWREMCEARERELRKSGRRDRKRIGWIPAHLAGYQEDASGGRERAKAHAREVAAAQAAAREQREDDEFVREWQLHAEGTRAHAARASKAPLDPMRALERSARWFFNGRPAEGRFPADEACVGMDLGTTNCVVAVLDAATGQPVIIPDASGSRLLPSVVAYCAETQSSDASRTEAVRPLVARGASSCAVRIGESAQRQAVSNGPSTFSSTKRLIGRTATAKELRELAALEMPYRKAGSGDVLIACPALRRTISPTDVAAELVRGMISTATAHLGTAVKRAVVTVPAYFGDAERAATETACLLAGLEEVRLLREPEAAAISYALTCQQPERVMVFDLGGGTFDVSILDICGRYVDVVATSGNPRLGGDDWDQAIADWLEQMFIEEHGLLVRGLARRRLIDAAEEAKLALSTEKQVDIDVPNLHGDRGIHVTLTRRKFEAITRKLLLQLVPPMFEVCKTAGVELGSELGTLAKGNITLARPQVQQWQQQVAWRWQRMVRQQRAPDERIVPDAPISRVLLVGGASRMPCIGRFLRRMTGLKAKPSVQPEEAVALGAAVLGGVLDGRIQQKVVNPYAHERAAAKLADDPTVFRA